MKLSINLIYFNIIHIYPGAVISRHGKRDNDMILSYPRYVNQKINFAPGGVYVAGRDMLPDSPECEGRCLLVTSDRISGTMKNITVITVNGVPADELFNQVLAIFEKYIEWDSQLQYLIFENAPLEKYLQCSLDVIGHPMSVHNENFSYIAKAGSVGSDDNIHNRNFFDPDFLLKVDRQRSSSIFFSKDLIEYNDDITHFDFMFLNLFSGNTFAGRLVVLSERKPFEPHEGGLIRHLSKYLQTALSFDSFNGGGKNLRRDSLIDYLSGKSHNDATILHLKTISPFSHLADDQWLYCAVINRPGATVSEQYISYQLERALPESVSVPFEDRIVLVCMNQHGQTQENFFEYLEDIFTRYDLIAGVSNPLRDFFDMRYCYQEALFALKQLDTLPEPSHMLLFRDVTLEHFLQYGFSIIPIRLICAQCVIRLAEHDIDASVSYCDSLEVYLNTGCNLAETARLLGITRNTFLARLERIMRYIDLDLENGDDRLYIMISLRLIRKTAPFGIAEKQ